MRKQLKKIIAITVAAIIALVVVSIIYITAVINPNDYKATISERLANFTGRDLGINGPIEWSFFPKLGIKIADITIYNSAHPKSDALAHIGTIKLSIEPKILLQALFSKKHKITSLLPTSIKNVAIEDGAIFWKNSQTNKNFSVTKINLRTKNFSLDQPFDLKGSFNFLATDSDLNLHATWSGKMHIAAEQKAYYLHQLQLTGIIDKSRAIAQRIDFTAEANLAADFLQQFFTIDNFQLRSDSLSIRGGIKVINILSKLKLTGDIKADFLGGQKLKLDQFSAAIAGDLTTINLNPININLANGTVTGKTAINLAQKIPQIYGNFTFSQIQINKISKELLQKERFFGKASGQIELRANGKSRAELLATLAGTGRITVEQGKVYGIDVGYQIRRAEALLNKNVDKQQGTKQETNPPQTRFDKFTGSWQIAKNILRTNDLLMQAPDFKITGAGTANLQTQRLDFSIKAFGLTNGTATDFFVPITITNTFSTPVIRPDVAVIVEQTLKKVLNQAIKRQLDNKSLPESLLRPLQKLLDKS